jgi:hypothetical protein
MERNTIATTDNPRFMEYLLRKDHDRGCKQTITIYKESQMPIASRVHVRFVR